MAKYHINAKGEPGACRAKKQCPFGGENDHYPTKEAAQSAYDAKMAPETFGEQYARVVAEGSTPTPAPYVRPSFQEGMDKAVALQEKHGITWAELRRIGSDHLIEDQPDLEEIGSSDVNHHLSGMANFDHEELEHRIKSFAELKKDREDRDREYVEGVLDRARGAFEALPKGKFSNKADVAIIIKALTGKKVSDAKLDAVIEDNHALEVYTPYTSSEDAQAAQKVFTALRILRNESGTPNTNPRIATFDPTTTSVFSNPQARVNPSVAVKALRREVAHGEWMRELASQDEASYHDAIKNSSDPAEATSNLSSAHVREYDARKSDARAEAMRLEMAHLIVNDPAYAKATPAAARSLIAGPVDDKFLDVPFGRTYPVK